MLPRTVLIVSLASALPVPAEEIVPHTEVQFEQGGMPVRVEQVLQVTFVS